MASTESPPALATSPPATGPSPLEPLAGVARELRTLRSQIDNLRRRLDEGTPASRSRLTALRLRLERLMPTLLALEARLDAGGRLDPAARELLRRVRAGLFDVRASAGGLIAGLSRQGTGGPDERLLMRRLKSFRSLAAAVATKLDAALPPAPSTTGAGITYLQLQEVPVAPPERTVAPLDERGVGGRHANSRDGPDPGGSSPWSTLASFAAGPGGAHSAGLAALGMLLIGFAAPRLRSSLRLPPSRRHTLALVALLERPG